ncbi:MAG: TonB-dependent receptor [Rhodothermales bacterium]|nr:TonB-dependent receptor [Rhodothermales bacterium]
MPLRSLTFLLVCCGILPLVAVAQGTGQITGTVTAARGGQAVAGVNVVVPGTFYAAVTDEAGRYVIAPVPAGTYAVQVNALGYRPAVQEVVVAAGAEVVLDFRLRPPRPQVEAVETDGRGGGLRPQGTLRPPALREVPAPTAGVLLRSLPGSDAGRRGALGFAPRLRGLHEAQIGVFVDGVPYAPEGPYAALPVLDRYDPRWVEQMTVVRGPYALTYGPEAHAAIAVETIERVPPTGRPRAAVDLGYATNGGLFDGAGTAAGTAGPVAVRGFAAYRRGGDFSSRSETIPSGYRSAEVRGHLLYTLSTGARLTLRAGHVDRRALAVPHLLIREAEGRATNAAARFQRAWSAGPVRGLDALAYGYRTEAAFRPPILEDGEPVQRRIEPGMEALGGRLALQLAPARRWRLDAGADARFLTAHTPVRGPDGIPRLPEARRVTAGVFVAAGRTLGRAEVSASARLDAAHTGASALPAGLPGVDPGGAHERTDVMPALSASAAAVLSPGWSLSAGLGTSARAPTLYERYAIEAPSSQAHAFRAVYGTPALDPERSTQADLWLARSGDRLDLTISAFARRIRRFIAPVQEGSRAAYAEGAATFAGMELEAGYALVGEFVTLRGLATALRAQNTTLDQPVQGVAPFQISLGGRVQAPARLFVIEALVHAAAPDRRVDTVFGEAETDGYVTADLRWGASLGRLGLAAGIDNLFNAAYARAANAQEALTGIPLREPGRRFYIRVRAGL